jgi:hypothetical protein
VPGRLKKEIEILIICLFTIDSSESSVERKNNLSKNKLKISAG